MNTNETRRVQDLPASWREYAAQLRAWAAAEGAARALEQAAAELEEALEQAADEPLTLAGAASESGYSPRRLRELLADGSVPNAGRTGRPRIRRGDLPRKLGKSSSFDAAAVARRVLAPHEAEPDRMLTAQEVAGRLGVSRRWVYRKADSLPFTRRLGAGTLRFSARGLERWQARR